METKKESNNNYYQEDKYNNIYSTHYNSRRDKLLMYRIKDRNICSSQESLNKSELCRNKSELIKMKEIIKRRKETQSRSKSEKEKEKGSESLNKIREKKDYIKVKKIIHRNKRNNNLNTNLNRFNQTSVNFFENNKKKENFPKIRNNIQFIDNRGKILIVKKRRTSHAGTEPGQTTYQAACL